jgi:endo-1,4-beta-xylanase
MRALLSFCALSLASAARLEPADLKRFYGRSPAPPARVHTPRDATQSLRAAAAARGLLVGAAINTACLANASEPYAATFAREYSLATAENECKWGATEAVRGAFTPEACRGLENATLRAGGSFRNHNLCWGSYNPAWLDALPDAASLRAALGAHIAAMGAAFGDSSFAFDVVNEAVSDDGRPDIIFKNSTWYPRLPDFVEEAFTFARASAPKAKLFYNDYAAEGLGAKSTKVFALAQDLAAKGLLDGVGLQMHVSVDAYPSFADVRANIARLVALGLEVHITEMDVRCVPAADGTLCGAARLAAQADIYAGLLGACLDNVRPTAASGRGGCKVFETWGFTDKHTWIYDFENPKHLNEMPLPFDTEYRIKPAYTAMLATLQGAAAAEDAITVDVSTATSLGHGVVAPDFASFSYEVPCAVPMLTLAGAPRPSFVGLMQQLQAVNGMRGHNIRVGGNSADESAYVPGTSALPYNASYRITAADFAAYLAAIPAWNGTVSPGLNFRGGADATLEAAHAAALGAAIGWGRGGFIDALEVGNVSQRALC